MVICQLLLDALSRVPKCSWCRFLKTCSRVRGIEWCWREAAVSAMERARRLIMGAAQKAEFLRLFLLARFCSSEQ